MKKESEREEKKSPKQLFEIDLLRIIIHLWAKMGCENENSVYRLVLIKFMIRAAANKLARSVKHEFYE